MAKRKRDLTTKAREANRSKHYNHGRGTKDGGPDAPDCPCRGTDEERACAGDGCGFCKEPRHCDDIADDPSSPEVLRTFLNWARSPAHGLTQPGPYPQLYAEYCGRTVRVTMASRFGDVGISYDMARETGYETRVAVESLSNFRDTP